MTSPRGWRVGTEREVNLYGRDNFRRIKGGVVLQKLCGRCDRRRHPFYFPHTLPLLDSALTLAQPEAADVNSSNIISTLLGRLNLKAELITGIDLPLLLSAGSLIENRRRPFGHSLSTTCAIDGRRERCWAKGIVTIAHRPRRLTCSKATDTSWFNNVSDDGI